MMTLKDVRAAYDTFSGKFSDVTRQLGLAGIAVVWLFRVGDKDAGGVPWNRHLLIPLACFVLALIFDALQYAYGSVIWGVYGRKKENELKPLGTEETAKFEPPACINWPTIACFCGKAVAAVVGHGFLLSYIWAELHK